MQESKVLHYILGTSLAMTAIFVTSALVMVNSQADSVTTSTSVNNAAPVVNSAFINTSPNTLSNTYTGDPLPIINNLNPGGTRTINLTGYVEDTNGSADITNVSGKFFRTPLGSGCSASDNDCYIVASCSMDNVGATPTQKRYNCAFPLNYYTDSTMAGGEFPADNFTAEVVVTDGTANGSSTILMEVAPLLALSIPNTINFGSLSLGVSTSNANNVEMTIEQNGNDGADVEVSMADAALTCAGIGSIPRNNIEWALTDLSHSAAGSNDLTGIPVDTNLAIGYRHGANPNKKLFWNIQIPAVGVKGSCTGTTTISAISS